MFLKQSTTAYVILSGSEESLRGHKLWQVGQYQAQILPHDVFLPVNSCCWRVLQGFFARPSLRMTFKKHVLRRGIEWCVWAFVLQDQNTDRWNLTNWLIKICWILQICVLNPFSHIIYRLCPRFLFWQRFQINFWLCFNLMIEFPLLAAPNS